MHKIIYSVLAVVVFTFLAYPVLSLDNQGFEVVSYSQNTITLKYTSNYSGDKLLSDKFGNTAFLPRLANAESVYYPEMPFPVFVSKVNMIVPSETGFKISIKKFSKTDIEDYTYSPYPEYLINDNTDLSKIKNEIPSGSANEPFTMKYTGISRNQHIAELQALPVNYNNITKKLQIIDSAYITVIFDLTDVKLDNSIKYFNSLSAVNFEMSHNWSARSNVKSGDDEYLQSPGGKTIASLSDGKWARIVIEEEGVYKLDASDLQSVGISVTPETARTLKIFGKGGKALSELVSDGKNNKMDEQEIIVRTKSDGNIESVIFYAAGTFGFEERNNSIQHYRNFYSNKNYYLITSGGDDGKRASALPNPQGDVLFRPASYTERVFVDEEVVNPFNPGAGREWFGRSFFSSPMPPVMMHDLDRNGEIKYRFALAQRAESAGTFTIFENNNTIGSVNVGSIQAYIAATRNFGNFTIPASQIASDNRSIIKFQYQNPQMSAVGYFDYYEMSYPRNFFAVNNTVKFISEKGMNGLTEFNINGYNGEIFGFDISDLKNPKLLTNKSVTGGIYSFCFNISDSLFKRFYISSNLHKPKLENIEIVGLRDRKDNAPIVVITHPDLYESALKFKEYREQTSGKKVVIVRTDHIFNEYASSLPDPTAIRDFLIDAYSRWEVKPEYLVLWGDGHYDFKNIATNKINYIPAYQTFEYDDTSFSEIYDGYATDDYFALIDGNDLVVDINFGRVTIDNPDLGFWIVDKIKHYETSSSEDVWRTNMIFVADDGPSEGTSYDSDMHSSQSEILQQNNISKANPNLQYDKIYLVEYPTIYAGSGRRKPAVTEDMLTRINTTGGLFLNWIGHGNPRVWSHEQILNRDITIPQMRNLDKLFFLTAATCDFGRFDDPEVRSGAEDMFLSRNGGAIAAFSASRIVFANENAALSYKFYSILLTRNPASGEYPTLGEAINGVKQTFTKTNDRKYSLIGDPTMKILLPDYRVNVSTINGINIADSNETTILPALSKVKISGYISSPVSNETVEGYNGTIVVTLRDGDIKMSVKEIFLNQLRGTVNYKKLGGNLNRSSYNVVNGRFEAEFIIPKDISFSDSLGKLFFYAASNDGKYASGSYQNVMISGFTNVDEQDTIPPQIDIYLDGRQFISGDMVTTSPRLIVDLFDESGINTTGLGIGHKIEAWVDDSPLSIDLTDKFSSSLSDSRRGTVEDILYGLSVGEHKVRIRAWDVYNNFSVSEVLFYIPEGGDGGLISNIYNYPNPFSDATNIVFRHNAQPPFEVNLEIFTINGVLIRNINGTINSLHTSQIFWDGLDNFNNRISDGVYIYNVKLSHDSGVTLGRGKLVKIGY